MLDDLAEFEIFEKIAETRFAQAEPLAFASFVPFDLNTKREGGGQPSEVGELICPLKLSSIPTTVRARQFFQLGNPKL